MSRVVLKGYVIATDKDLPAIQAALPKHIELTRQESGCIVFEVTQDAEEKNRFNVYEEFIDQAAFDAHQYRTQRSEWAAASANLAKFYSLVEGI